MEPREHAKCAGCLAWICPRGRILWTVCCDIHALQCHHRPECLSSNVFNAVWQFWRRCNALKSNLLEVIQDTKPIKHMMMMMMMKNCVSGVELAGKLGAKRKQTCKSMQELGGKNHTRECKRTADGEGGTILNNYFENKFSLFPLWSYAYAICQTSLVGIRVYQCSSWFVHEYLTCYRAICILCSKDCRLTVNRRATRIIPDCWMPVNSKHTPTSVAPERPRKVV